MSDVVHPAQYSAAIVERIVDRLGDRKGLLLDPCAGPGLHLPRFVAKGRRVVGIEIEQPWVDLGSKYVRQGDSRNLKMKDGSVSTLVVSFTYGNRFSDRHNAREQCSNCDGGKIGGLDCPKCEGTGKRNHTRRSYTHDIRAQTGDADYQLHTANTGRYKATEPRYWELNLAILAECTRVAAPGAEWLFNVSDYERTRRVKGEKIVERIPVSAWYLQAFVNMGWEWIDGELIPTQRMLYGANRGRRVDGEWLLAFRKPS